MGPIRALESVLSTKTGPLTLSASGHQGVVNGWALADRHPAPRFVSRRSLSRGGAIRLCSRILQTDTTDQADPWDRGQGTDTALHFDSHRPAVVDNVDRTGGCIL